MTYPTPLVSLTDNSDNLLRRKWLEPSEKAPSDFRQNQNQRTIVIFLCFSVVLPRASRFEVFIRAIKKGLTKATVR